MTLNEFTSGVNTSFSTELNQNAADAVNRVDFVEGSGTIDNTAYTTIASVLSGSAPKDNATLLIECWVTRTDNSSGVTGGVQTYNLTSSTQLQEDTFTTGGSGGEFTHFLVQTITLASKGDTASIAYQAKRASTPNLTTKYYLKTSFIE